MADLRRLTENFRGRAGIGGTFQGRNRLVTVLLGGVIAVATGAVLVKASDDPGIRQVFMEFNKPIRRAVQTYVPQVRAPQFFRNVERREAPVQGAAAPRYLPTNQDVRVERITGLPQGALDAQSGEGLTRLPAVISVPKPRRALTAREPGLETATNYCVRLCDGFAFPIGRAGIGDEGAHEAACRLACPNAQVALFTMPKGAKDFSEAHRGGASYSALPTAFRYQTRYDQSCTCRAPGQTQSAAALLSDFTLRRGDLAMTRIGVRHFDGASRFPHREANFSDALKRISNPKEIRLIKGMEAASLRGNLPAEAHAALRQRIVTEIRQAEIKAGTRKVSELARPSTARRFEEMQAQRRYGPQPVRVIERRQGLVAMN